MPDPLLQAMIARAQQDVERKLYAQPAGTALPSVLKAADIVRQIYPADMVGVRVKDIPWQDPEAFSNTVATTPILGLSQDNPENISVDPAYGIMNTGPSLAPIIAHELEHVRQNRRAAEDPAYASKRRANMFALPYRSRPDEIAAYREQDRFNTAHPHPPSYNNAQDDDMVLEQMRRLFIPDSSYRR